MSFGCAWMMSGLCLRTVPSDTRCDVRGVLCLYLLATLKFSVNDCRQVMVDVRCEGSGAGTYHLIFSIEKGFISSIESTAEVEVYPRLTQNASCALYKCGHEKNQTH